jgi:hypothetical protein
MLLDGNTLKKTKSKNYNKNQVVSISRSSSNSYTPRRKIGHGRNSYQGKKMRFVGSYGI